MATVESTRETAPSGAAGDLMTPHTSYRPDIDGLRAVAILGVVAYHAGVWGVSGGFLGVDVFFVISGYLITQLLHQQTLASGRISLVDFYSRRARRLLPALLTVISLTVIAGHWLLPPNERAELSESALASLGFAANLFFLSNTAGYFDGPSDLKPLLHLWSLAVEEQFYLVWPLVLMAIHRFAPAKARVRSMQGVTGLIIAGSVALGVWLQSIGNSNAAFFISPTRAWELGAGALVALSNTAGRLRNVRGASHIALIGILMILAAYAFTSEQAGFQPRAMLLCVAGTVLVIAGGSAVPGAAAPRLLSSKLLVTIGKLSYSWYLWHWPLLSLMLNVTQKQTSLAMNCLCMLIALALAALTGKFIENPIRFGTRSGPRNSLRDVKLGGVAILLTVGMVVAVFMIQLHGTKTPREQLVTSIAADLPTQFTSDCLIERSAWTGVLPAHCKYGPESQPVKLVVYGDSHAAHWMPMIEALLGPENRVSVEQFTMSGCQPLLPGTLKLSAKTAVCNSYEKQALPKILSLGADGLKGVVLAGRWSQPRHLLWSRYPSSTQRMSFAAAVHSAAKSAESDASGPNYKTPDFLRAGLKPVLDALQAKGIKVLILLDAPEFKYPVPLCVYYDADAKKDCGVSRAEYERAFGEDREEIKAIAAHYPSVHVFDPVPDLCSADECPPFWKGHPVLMDDSHISASTARALAPFAKAELAWLLN